jgi:hypothetical protein
MPLGVLPIVTGVPMQPMHQFSASSPTCGSDDAWKRFAPYPAAFANHQVSARQWKRKVGKNDSAWLWSGTYGNQKSRTGHGLLANPCPARPTRRIRRGWRRSSRGRTRTLDRPGGNRSVRAEDKCDAGKSPQAQKNFGETEAGGVVATAIGCKWV